MNSSQIFLTILFTFLTLSSNVCLAENSPKDFLAVHNAARAEVGVPPLVWNQTLASYAQDYANKKSVNCKFEHSQGPYGENLAGGWGMNATAAVKFWLTEKPNYDYSSNKCKNDECLHYTQIVWRNTAQLGCAMAKCQDGSGFIFVICNYDPCGNYEGERPY